jgi:hypothetical protein
MTDTKMTTLAIVDLTGAPDTQALLGAVETTPKDAHVLVTSVQMRDLRAFLAIEGGGLGEPTWTTGPLTLPHPTALSLNGERCGYIGTLKERSMYEVPYRRRVHFTTVAETKR